MLIIFDKDDTLVHSLDGRPANTLDEQVLIDGVVERCAQLRAEGHTLAIASNQGGAAFGYFSVADAHALVAQVAKAIGAQHYAVCVCHPHGSVPGAARESEYRKPNPGMLLYLMDALGFGAGDTIYVGDRDDDREAANRAGVRFAWAQEFFAQENLPG
ncbi:MAG: HAD-IIIA family hydrolase [Chloroflexi bacterium]|nr:HAD-IIIA family hydrolase [Chloroflexota bacterium]